MKHSLRALLAASMCIGILAACEPKDELPRFVGQLESDRVELTAEVAEPIVSWRVREGQAVTGGTVLIEQDTSRIESALAGAKAALAQSQARQDELIRGPRSEQISAARANVAGAERELDFRKTQFLRAEQLFERALASPDVRDQAQAALDAAESQLEVQRARLAELLGGTTTEELRQAEQNVRQLEARLSALAIDLERHSLSAPADGLVDSILFHPGERPVPGQPAVILLTGAQAYARIYVPEQLRARVQPGAAATVYVDGMDKALAGRVRWISSESAFTPYFALTERDRGRLSYFAKIDILDSLERLPDGVPVEVELDIPGPSR